MAKLRVDKIASVGVSTENTGSVFFDGSSDWLRARGGDNFNDFNFGSSDFTIEGFFYANDVNGTDIPIALAADTVSANSDAGWYIRYQSNKIEGKAYSGSSEIGATQSGTVSNNTWYHVAYVREGSTFTLYVDGVAVSTATSSDSLNWNSGWKVEIGSGYGGANYFAGYISNLRICKGHAVYKSNFAVPVRELDVHPGPDNDRTVLLACYDGENIFAEKTGRHILASQGNRTSSPTLAAGETPVGITTFNPGLTRSVDATAGPTFQGGAGYISQNWLTLPKGTTPERFPNFATNAVDSASARGLIAGGFPSTDVIQYVTIATLGDAIDFGNLHAGSYGLGACASRTRGLFLGGDDPAVTNRIQYVTIESTGNTTDFGNLTVSRRYVAGCSNSTRGVAFGGGSGPGAPQAKNEIDYVTIASTGDAIDFGNLTGTYYSPSGCSSPVRGLSFGGRAGTNYYNAIDYITIASTGNAQDFGDLATLLAFSTAASNSTRGMVFGGLDNPANINTIQFVTIASSGNTQDFGDLTEARRGEAATASATRAISGGGYNGSDYTNAIEYVTISTTGNAVNFGDQINEVESHAGLSNGHGGLG